MAETPRLAHLMLLLFLGTAFTIVAGLATVYLERSSVPGWRSD